jgi:adenosylcobinamide kinase/adenosylcobinamide-phosphate guanylyltransferase
VAAHQARRPAHWHTVETGDVAELLRGAGPEDAVLVDCVTLWLGGCLDDPGRDQASAELVAAWRSTRARVVLVTNEVGSSVHPATPAGRAFADALGTLNAQLAREADEVWHVVAGQPTRLR